MSLLGDSELAVTESVPELDSSVAGSGNDLSVVGGEGDRENVVGMSDEASGGGSGRELPKSKSLVPGSGKSVGTVRGDDLDSCLSFKLQDRSSNFRQKTYTIGNNVRVTVQRSLGISVGALIAGQVPNNQRLVAGS